MWMSRIVALGVVLASAAHPVQAATWHVPKDFKSIQAALDAARAGDTVLVTAGAYREQVRLKDGVTLKSAGDDTPAQRGLRRAEATIIEHAGANAKGPAVVLAEGSVLDGFTVTRAGAFDQKEYDYHDATSGEMLPDERGAVGIKDAVPAVSVLGVTATVRFCIVHDNGHAGIGCAGQGNSSRIYKNFVFRNMGGGIGIREGATPIVRGNKCYNNRRAGIGVRMKGTNPIIEDNDCFGNGMAGIGSRDGAAPVIRGNRCYKNHMAGIGARNEAAPTIRFNKCYKNKMAGIGARDGAAPIIRANKCCKNEMAGIGCRLGARPLIVDNDCHDNQLAGIGAREAAMPIIQGNRCYRNHLAGIGTRDRAFALIEGNECKENKFAGIGARHGAVVMVLHNKCLDNNLVAIGLRTGSIGYILDNELVRSGGMPPLLAVREGSTAVVVGNRLQGGGVAGILVEGTARIRGNRLEGGGKSGSAVWGWNKADLTIVGNQVDGYRNLINSTGCKVTVVDNVVRNFQGAAITVTNPLGNPIVAGNVAVSKNPKDKALVVDGTPGKPKANVLQEPGDQADLAAADEKFWAVLKKQAKIAMPQRTGTQMIEDGSWKLVVEHGKTTTYKLYHLKGDPQKDLAAQLDNHVFRLRGRLERQEAVEFKAQSRKEEAAK